jgi:hypothetical protein
VCTGRATGGPDANYTQRATFDASRGEIYVLTGLMKDNKNSQPDAVMSSLWVYNCKAAAWCVCQFRMDRVWM